MMRPYVGSWKRLAVQGAAAVIFGLATLVWPSITLGALVLLWGAFAFVDGVTALSAAIGDRLLVHRGWVAFWGVTGIAATPFRAKAVETALGGQMAPTPEMIARAAARVADRVEALGDIHASPEFRLHLAEVNARRALTRAFAA